MKGDGKLCDALPITDVGTVDIEGGRDQAKECKEE